MVRSSAHPALGEAISGIRESWTGSMVVKELSGEEEGDRAAVSQGLGLAPTIVIVLGDRAAELVAAADPKVPVIGGFVAHDKLRVGAGGVSIEPPSALEIQELLHLMPTVKRLGILYDPEESEVEAGRVAVDAGEEGIEVVRVKVESPSAVPRAFLQARSRLDALLMLPDHAVVASPEALSFLALGCLERGILLYTRGEVLVKGGALFSLTVDPRDVGNTLGLLAGRAVSGAGGPMPPGTRPGPAPGWVRPTRYRLVLNAKTLEALDLAIPEERVVARGDLLTVDLGPGGQEAPTESPARIVRATTPALPSPKGRADEIVVLRVRVSVEGKLLSAAALRGDAALRERAIDEVKTWEFAPALSGGKPAESSLVLTVRFSGAP